MEEILKRNVFDHKTSLKFYWKMAIRCTHRVYALRGVEGCRTNPRVRYALHFAPV